MKTNSIRPVLLVSDLPAWGRVALASAIPLVEAAGLQACSLPTALLSTHGAYPGFVIEPQTAFLTAAWRHLKSLDLTFAGASIGLVGAADQFVVLEDIAATIKTGGGLLLVDPILGDNGRRYGLFRQDYVPSYLRLLAYADVITPNLTETALLLGRQPDEVPRSEAEVLDWMKALALLGPRRVVLTSAPFFDSPGTTGVAWYDAGSGRSGTVDHIKFEGGLPGTGDALAARLFASLVTGRSFAAAVAHAVRKTLSDFKRTRQSGRPALWGLAGRLQP